MKLRSSIAALLVLLMLGAAACGSDEPDVDEIVDDAQEALEEGLEEAEQETEDLLDAAGDFGSNECLQLATAMAAAAGAATGVAADSEEAIQAFRNMSEIAPDEIRDDLELMANALGDFFAALDEAGIDFNDPSTYTSEEAAQVLTEASAALESSGLTEASENINATLTEICG